MFLVMNPRVQDGWAGLYVSARPVIMLIFPLLTRGQAAFLVHLLSLFSILNAAYTFLRKRHYRLFETDVEIPPSTPSAHRVRVDSSPASSSPLRFLSTMLASTTAEARAHPDASRDVWEISVWDPTPLCLRTFCLFSPGHVLVYWLFLPTAPQDARPSSTVVTTIFLAALLSVQLSFLHTNFSQQSKDAAVIHKEVLNEYDIKYVHPRTQPLMRDVGTQFSSNRRHSTMENPTNAVDTYNPVIIINKGFHTKPNPNYINHIDPQASLPRATPSRDPINGSVPAFQTPIHLRDASSPVQPRTAVRYSQMRPSVGTGIGDGGNLGVYSHANSPLKKASSMNFASDHRDRERSASPIKRQSSPLKRTSVPGGMNETAVNQRWAHLQGAQSRRESGHF